MTATPSDPQSAGNERDPLDLEQSPIALTFEDKLRLFWRRHRTLLIVGCLAVALAIAGVGIYDYVENENEAKIEAAYAAAKTPEALKAFAEANSEHTLGGVAFTRLADDAMLAGKMADAQANYEKATKILKDGPLAARAKLGLAVAKVIGGKTAEGTAELKALVDDPNQLKGIRAEAGYHLASLAAEAGVAADVEKYSVLLMQIDPASIWAQRAIILRAELPVTAAPNAAIPAPAIQFTPPAK
jgi:predicted negative regulator of RcsB-dependent stress response